MSLIIISLLEWRGTKTKRLMVDLKNIITCNHNPVLRYTRPLNQEQDFDKYAMMSHDESSKICILWYYNM